MTTLLIPISGLLFLIGTPILLIYLLRRGQLQRLSFALISAGGLTLGTMVSFFAATLLSENPDIKFAVLFGLAVAVSGFVSAFFMAYLLPLPRMPDRPADE
jgi:predicted permease